MKQKTIGYILQGPEQKTLYAEYLKERLYSSITLIAVNIGIFQHLEHTTLWQAFGTISSTILWLYLASFLSSVIAFKALHNSEIAHEEITKSIISHRGIFHGGSISLIMLFIASIGIISLKSAIFGAIILGTLNFLASMLYVFMSRDKSIIANIFIFITQIILFLFIIILKLWH